MNGIFIIDGARFHTLEEFYEIVSSTMIPGARWGRNLDAFNDILRGGFGTPDGGFTIRWINASLSRQRLGKRDFDLLVETIRIHGVRGEEAEDRVVLELDE
ncbi:MAG: barstar family protein [Chthoniobacteraceae bacterium]